MPNNQQTPTNNQEFLSASMVPTTLNGENRTVDVVFYSGVDVERVDWMTGEPYMLRFNLDGADLSMLKNGAPVFDNHDSHGGAAGQMGVVENAWRDGKEFKAKLRFSKRPAVDGLWQDIADKIVQKFSMGVSLLEKKDISPQDGKQKIVEVMKWQPFEISTAPLPADNNTRTLAAERADVVRASSPKEQPMAEEKTITEAGEQARTEEARPVIPAAPDEQLNAARSVGVTAEQGRITGILQVAKVCGLSMTFAETHIKNNTSLDTFRTLAIDEQAKRASQPEIRHVHADILRDESETRRRNMTAALLERFEPNRWSWDDAQATFCYHKDGGQRAYDGGRNYAACTLLDIAKECLGQQGMRWQNKNRTEIAQLAFQSTSDFPYILADVAGKSLRAGYEMVESQWRLIASRRTAADFKTQKELTLDASARLEKVPESGEFKHGRLVEGKETYSLSTYGKIIGITRQAIINDDLGAFTRTPMLLGQEVAMLEADTVWGIVTTNGNLADGTALFAASASRGATVAGNLVTGSGTVISADDISVMRVMMMRQTSPGGKSLGIQPRYLVAPATKSQLAEQYTSSSYVAATPATINVMAGRLTPIIEARLDASSTTAWYLFADPNTPNGTVLIYAYLEGQQGPYTETRNGFDVDGVEIKIRHDFAAAAVDFRGAVKNDGA